MILKENIFFSKNVHSYRVCSFNIPVNSYGHVETVSKPGDQNSTHPLVITSEI